MPINSDNYRPNLDNGRLGWVYVLSNKSMPGLYKIGATRKHPLQRAKELGAGTGVPTSFSVAYYRDFTNAFAAETLVHQHFENARTDASREFFAVPIEEIIDFIDTLGDSPEYEELSSQGLTGGDHADGELRPRIDPDGARRAYQDCQTPFAELFATFPDDGSPRELTTEERAACNQIRRNQL